MAQKYIVGDLVKYKVGGLEFIAEITNTSKYGYCFKCVGDDISGTLCKEFTKDIPLTSEILEKNGWKKPDAFDSYWLDKIGLLQDGDIWHSALGSTKIAITLGDIQYIHELQHLLFGLGLNSEMEV